MLIIGLTGSIATGKTTVSQILSSPPYSLPIIDADKIAAQVLDPGTAGYKAVIAHFGPTTPDLVAPASLDDIDHARPDACPPINRANLGKRVFGSDNEADRKVLNGIVHPAVGWEMYKRMLWAYARGKWAVVLDIPLLFEAGWEASCGTVVVVAVKDKELQLRRLLDRNQHLSPEDAKNRIDSQWDVRDKADRAKAKGKGFGAVLWNDGGRDDLRRQVDELVKDLKKRSPQWWALLLLFNPAAMLLVAHWNYLLNTLAKQKWEKEKEAERVREEQQIPHARL